jgi:hypothetical protein
LSKDLQAELLLQLQQIERGDTGGQYRFTLKLQNMLTCNDGYKPSENYAPLSQSLLYAVKLPSFFEEAWRVVRRLKVADPIFDDKLRLLDQNKLVEEFYVRSLNAYQFLGIEVSAETLRAEIIEGFDTYSKVISDSETVYPPKIYFTNILPILYCILVLLFQLIVEDGCNAVMKRLQSFSDVLREEKCK